MQVNVVSLTYTTLYMRTIFAVWVMKLCDRYILANYFIVDDVIWHNSGCSVLLFRYLCKQKPCMDRGSPLLPLPYLWTCLLKPHTNLNVTKLTAPIYCRMVKSAYPVLANFMVLSVKVHVHVSRKAIVYVRWF